VKGVADYPQRVAELHRKYAARQLPLDLASFAELANEVQRHSRVEQFEHEGTRLELRYIAKHYYLPLILSSTERVDYIRHVVRHQSEVRFVNELEAYTQQAGNGVAAFDWWAFSKLDETLDRVYIPYYDAAANRIRQFKPDFIFWLQKGTDYVVAFVDPKGMQQSDYQHKIDGYKQLFVDSSGAVRVTDHNGLRVRV
jgi:hypothetical protein